MDFHNRCFLESSFYGECNVVTRLLRSGVDVNVCDESGNFAVHKATQGDKVEILRLLQKHGANLNAKNKDQNTPLHIAAWKANKVSIEFLLKSGADVNATNEREETALFTAIKNLSNEMDLQSTQSSEIPVNMDKQNKLKEIIESLINTETIDLSLSNRNGLNCLHYSVKLGVKVVFDKIVEKSPSLLSVADKYGFTNLHYAVQYKRIDILETLLHCEVANDTSLHKQSMSPLHCAICSGNLSVAELLVSHGSDCNVIDSLSNTPMHLVFKAFNSNYDCEKSFIEKIQTNKVAAILQIFKENRIPLNAHLVLAAHMIKNGNANLFVENNQGDTPLDFISETAEENLKIVKIFTKMYNDQLKVEEAKRETEFTKLKKKLEDTTCPVCLDEQKEFVFLCGHGVCSLCSPRIQHCHTCRAQIRKKIRLN